MTNEYLAPFVDELFNLGVREAVFSPGSRSTALAMLFEEYKKYDTYVNIDERSAAFFALGIAKAKKRPVDFSLYFRFCCGSSFQLSLKQK